MPWKDSRVMDQRLQFVAAFQRGETGLTGLCAALRDFARDRLQVARPLSRARAGGAGRPVAYAHHPAHALAPELAETILALRQERPHWGPKKLKAVLARRAPEQPWPAASTIGDLLKRRGLILPRSRRRRAVLERTRSHREAQAPNERWCIDFKGWLRSWDGCRCDPLTLTDDATRYLLLVEILEPLRRIGVRVAIDNFGAGCSSLARLRDLPLDLLKVDRAFLVAPTAGVRRSCARLLALHEAWNCRRWSRAWRRSSSSGCCVGSA